MSKIDWPRLRARFGTLNWSHWPDRIMAMVAVLALIASLVSASFQYSMTRESIELTQQAWLAAKVTVDLYPKEGEPTVKIRWKNTGQGPALNVSTIWSISMPGGRETAELSEDFVGRMALRSDPEDRNPPSSVEYRLGLVGPGDEVNRSLKIFQNYTEPMDPQKVNGGWFTLIVSGWADYEDIFGNRRWTSFCMRYEGAINDVVPCRIGNASGTWPKTPTASPSTYRKFDRK